MARPEKEATVAELAGRLEQASGLIVTDYRGLRVKDMASLRRQLREAGAEYAVVKNTLLRIAADQVGQGQLAPALEGPTAVVFTPEDASAAAKALLAFARQHGLPQVRAVMMGGRLYPPAAAQDLATLPGRETMLAMVMAGMQGPITGLVTVLQSILGELAATLQALAERRQAAAA